MSTKDWRRLEQAREDAEERFDAGDLDGAARVLDRSLQRIADVPDGEALDLWIDALCLRAELHAECEEDSEAFACLDRIRARDPRDVGSELLRARLHLTRGETAAAEQVVEALGEVPDEVRCEVLEVRGVLAERAGDLARADRLFAEAHALHPDGHVVPVRLDVDEVEMFAADTIAALPESVHRALENVMITLQEHPDPGPLAEGDALLGFYEGHTLHERDAAFLPDRIRLYLRNIERSGSTREEVFEQLRITLLHEIGHHLGLDEDDLDRLGLG